jgi:hypothetical protein
VGIGVSLNTQRLPRALALLEEHRVAIEQEVGVSLNWNPHPEKQIKVIKTASPFNIADRGQWPGATEWLVGMAIRLHKAISPRIGQAALK